MGFQVKPFLHISLLAYHQFNEHGLYMAALHTAAPLLIGQLLKIVDYGICTGIPGLIYSLMSIPIIVRALL